MVDTGAAFPSTCGSAGSERRATSFCRSSLDGAEPRPDPSGVRGPGHGLSASGVAPNAGSGARHNDAECVHQGIEAPANIRRSGRRPADTGRTIIPPNGAQRRLVGPIGIAGYRPVPLRVKAIRNMRLFHSQPHARNSEAWPVRVVADALSVPISRRENAGTRTSLLFAFPAFDPLRSCGSGFLLYRQIGQRVRVTRNARSSAWPHDAPSPGHLISPQVIHEIGPQPRTFSAAGAS
jgi:hypothetical protein